jgi:hypothetical protein
MKKAITLAKMLIADDCFGTPVMSADALTDGPYHRNRYGRIGGCWGMKQGVDEPLTTPGKSEIC